MEPINADYFYTLALLSITFVGFTAIVMILRAGLGNPLSRYDTLVARFFMAWGFLITYGSMMPPLLAGFELDEARVWDASGIVTGVALLALSFGYPLLRARATGEPAPVFVFCQSAVGVIIAAVLLANAAAFFRPSLAPAIYAAMLTLTLLQASAGFIVTLNVIVAGAERGAHRRKRT